MRILESAENYLECILQIKQQKGNVRSIDIVNEMGFKKSSVSVAMKQFRENGYIVMADDGLITLTDKGLEIAENVLERHNLLKKALMSIGVSETVAEEDACKIEHDLSEETFEKLKQHIGEKDS